jgi:hypothetical protein
MPVLLALFQDSLLAELSHDLPNDLIDLLKKLPSKLLVPCVELVIPVDNTFTLLYRTESNCAYFARND